MKIALAQLNYHIGNFTANNEKIISYITRAKADGADLIVFAELAIGGYPAKDLLRNAQFIQQCTNSLHEIAQVCQGISCVIGSPMVNTDPEGKALYNAAVVMADGQIQHICKKSLLPDYDVFDEYRYFEPNRTASCIDINGQKVALTICEDLWDDEVSNSYVGDLMAELRKENPSLIINIAASPFSYTHFENRINVLKRNVIKAGCPLVYVNQIGAHTDIIFDGRSLALDRNGNILSELKAFTEDYAVLDIYGQASTLPEQKPSEIALIHQALLLGIRDYFQKSGFKKAVLGLSGGLDSAIVAALAGEALGAENVLAAMMPSKYSSEHSVKDALDLVENTGCAHQIIPIEDIAKAFDQTLADSFTGQTPDLTEENIQARIR